MDPLFLTYKLKISNVYSIYDYQLREHLRVINSIYMTTKKCCEKHKHNNEFCYLTTNKICPNSDELHSLVIDFKSLSYHKDLDHLFLYTTECDVHTHKPPCNNCINCISRKSCIVQLPISCNLTTNIQCIKHNGMHNNIKIEGTNYLNEHIYNMKNPLFYICLTHRHKHFFNSRILNQHECIIQGMKCCNNAILITEYLNSFIIKITNYHELQSNELSEFKIINKYTIYDPQIMREQSINFFISFIRGILNLKVLNDYNMIQSRYQRYHSSTFAVSNIKSYISGKDSAVRLFITGFPAEGWYQTTIISCMLEFDTLLVPQKMYDLMKQQYYVDFGVVKRDPAIRPTCVFVLKCKRNPDPNIDTLIISDFIADLMHQDQDGDRNGVYLLKRYTSHYSYRHDESFNFKISKLEMIRAYKNMQTLIALPRYEFSEQAKRTMIMKYDKISSEIEYFKYYYHKGIKFLTELSCGYMQKEYITFRNLLQEIYMNNERELLTIDDIFGNNSKWIQNMINVGITNQESVDLMLNNIKTFKSISDSKESMILQKNKYIESHRNLKNCGRIGFAMLYKNLDNVVILGNIYTNKVWVYNFRNYCSAYLFAHKPASLSAFVQDLIDNYNKTNLLMDSNNNKRPINNDNDNKQCDSYLKRKIMISMN